MNQNHVNWCTCCGHDDDWTLWGNYYARHFIPRSWTLEYQTMSDHERGRTLYMLGSCNHCGGVMRSGAGLAQNIIGDRFLADVYHTMVSYRPYDWYAPENGIYHSTVIQRGLWYQQQDDMALADRNEQFLNLFHAEDRAAVEDWLARNTLAEPYSKPRRDRKSTLFQRIWEDARTNQAVGEVETIIDRILPNDSEPMSPDDNCYLTDYRFDVVPHLVLGSEGVLLTLYLEGSFDSSYEKSTVLGTFKTRRIDQEACRLMGALGGTLVYYAQQYIIRELHRYTPERELKQKEGTKWVVKN